MNTVHLGFEVDSGEPIAVPLKHTAVTGMTQDSGKTTTLEALAARCGRPVIAFVTKRGERAFAGGRRLTPYFRDRADWQFVDQLLEAQLREKNKFLRPWIMRICRTTRTLADVHAAVKKALDKAKGFNEGVYTQLEAYLELIVPEIARARLAGSIDLALGLNVMDVSEYQTPMQMLFVQSAIDWVNAKERGVVTVVPEAWEFIPEGKGSPVKASAVSLVRKGAGIGNLLWADSQDMAGVDKVILRGCAVWLIGAQREANEIKRNLSNIPAGIERPKPADIAHLARGQFFACWEDRTVKAYVQPAWMDAETASRIARGEKVRVTPPEPPKDEPMSKAIEEKLDKLLDAMAQQAAPPRAPVDWPAAKNGTEPAPGTVLSADEDALYQRFRSRLLADPVVLRVLATQPELEVIVERKTVAVDLESARGMIAMLIKEGFLDKPTKSGDVWKEMKRRWNYKGISARAYEQLETLAKMGFLTVESDGYQAVKGMKVRVVEK